LNILVDKYDKIGKSNDICGTILNTVFEQATDKYTSLVCGSVGRTSSFLKTICDKTTSLATGTAEKALLTGWQPVCDVMLSTLGGLGVNLAAIVNSVQNKVQSEVQRVATATCGRMICNGSNGLCNAVGAASNSLAIISDKYCALTGQSSNAKGFDMDMSNVLVLLTAAALATQ